MPCDSRIIRFVRQDVNESVMKVIFSIELQYKRTEEDYEISALPPIGTTITTNGGIGYLVENILWSADMDKKTCVPTLMVKIVPQSE